MTEISLNCDVKQPIQLAFYDSDGRPILFNLRVLSLSLFVFHVTCNEISVIYVTTQMCRRTEEEGCTYGRDPNAIDISQVSLTCPSYTETGLPFLYVDSDTPPHLVHFYDTLGIWRRILDLNPRRPHGGIVLCI